MNSTNLWISDPDILGGEPVFAGTRVPIKTLFDYLEDDYSLTEFLEFFPTVDRELALAVLDKAEQTYTQNPIADASTAR
jgi:uncharacterized protein (DUF433 family)